MVSLQVSFISGTGGLSIPTNVSTLRSGHVTREIIDYQQQFRLYEEYLRIEKEANNLSIDTTSIHFMSEEQINALSILECISPATEGRDTVNDPRMGTIKRQELCDTCKQDYRLCNGHLGRITLVRPYVHPMAMMQTIYILQSVCNSCGYLLIRPEEYEADADLKKAISGLRDINLLRKVAEMTVSNKSIQCKSPKNTPRTPCKPNPSYVTKVKKEVYKIIKYITTTKKVTNETEMNIEDIKKIFNMILDERDLAFLGFSKYAHPRNFILSVLPVIPELNRPPKYRDGQMDQDHLTTVYTAIISTNNKLRELYKNVKQVKEGEYQCYNINSCRASSSKVANEIECEERNLYRHIYHFINNSDKKYCIGKSDPLKSVLERLVKDGKEAYMRKHAMGKRVNFSSRTVLAPGSLPFGYIGYPEETKVLTVPEMVTTRNIERIKQMYKDGKIPTIIPGSGRSIGRRISTAIVAASGQAQVINVGDKVFRLCSDGDYTLFNRQPTLHKYSIMGYQVLLHPQYTMKLHSSYDTPHNADYDGDEGNEHVPQTNEAIAECKYIANVQNCIIGNQFSRPVMGIVYNGTIGAYLLSTKIDLFSEHDWMEGFTQMTRNTDATRMLDDFNYRLNRENVVQFSGRGLISTLFPVDFFYDHKGVKIRNGIFVLGTLTSDHLGPTNGSIIHVLHKFYNSEIVSRFFTEAQYLFDWYLEYRGFSVGVSDTISINPQLVEQIIDHEVTKAIVLIRNTYKENMTAFDKVIQAEKIEGYLSNITGSLSNKDNEDNLAKIGLHPNNPLNIMVKSGAKGNLGNITQMIGCLGQQFIKGKLPIMDMTQGTRCLPYFEENSDDIAARGFVRSSFEKGLKPSELIFHMASARIGLIDSAISTADTGYTHHQISKVLEGITVNYLGGVMNPNNIIFQYSAGLNSSNLIRIKSKNVPDILSPIDFKTVIGKLNYAQGYDEW